jgi:hypothetical protein
MPAACTGSRLIPPFLHLWQMRMGSSLPQVAGTCWLKAAMGTRCFWLQRERIPLPRWSQVSSRHSQHSATGTLARAWFALLAGVFWHTKGSREAAGHTCCSSWSDHNGEASCSRLASRLAIVAASVNMLSTVPCCPAVGPITSSVKLCPAVCAACRRQPFRCSGHHTRVRWQCCGYSQASLLATGRADVGPGRQAGRQAAGRCLGARQAGAHACMQELRSVCACMRACRHAGAHACHLQAGGQVHKGLILTDAQQAAH